MKFVALISGGKDSIFNIIKCIENGHELIALINLYPASKTNLLSMIKYKEWNRIVICIRQLVRISLKLWLKH
jgi:diphthamide synthase (EF-2-diphthine--ammonia ligase)